MKGKKILVTGATGRVARPVAESLAADNEVWALARFTDAAAEEGLRLAGVRPFRGDMVAGDLSGLPRDFTHVLHAAFLRNWDDVNGVVDDTVRTVGRLMTHAREAEAFWFMSSTVVYRRLERGHLHTEDDPLGGTSTAEWNPAYAASKIAAEGAARAFAHMLGLPTVMTRLSVQYGSTAGGGENQGGLPLQYLRWMQAGRTVPVGPNRRNWCSPIHGDDVVRFAPAFWSAASVPAELVNLGGDEAVCDEDILGYLSELTGVIGRSEPSEAAPGMVALDPAKRRSITGPCEVSWRDGFRRTVELYFPELIAAD